MSTVFILHHVHEFEDGHEDVKLIGIFSSEALARAAQQRVSDQPGFRDLLEGFEISEHCIDGNIGWPEGYVTVQPEEECKAFELNNLIRDCNSDRVPSTERVTSAWRYCKCFSSESEGLEVLVRELSREQVELLAQAASEVLAGFHDDEFGFYSGGSQASFDSENLVTREFISALSKIAGT